MRAPVEGANCLHGGGSDVLLRIDARPTNCQPQHAAHRKKGPIDSVDRMRSQLRHPLLRLSREEKHACLREQRDSIVQEEHSGKGDVHRMRGEHASLEYSRQDAQRDVGDDPKEAE